MSVDPESSLSIQEDGQISISKPCLMGILNITPDSFSDGGKFKSTSQVVETAQQFESWGAQILDIGGESTRPGAEEVSESEELSRVIPVIEAIRKNQKIWISIDTQKAKVAEEALAAGANIINDISACRHDPKMWEVAQRAPLILMHMKGTPRTMQQKVEYQDVVEEVFKFFQERLEKAKSEGLKLQQLILDPGIGFGKLVEHNLVLLRRIKRFKNLGCPLLLGTSRKSFIGKVLGDVPVEERLLGTAATVAYGLLKGVSIFRVHDVQEMQQIVKMIQAIEEGILV